MCLGFADVQTELTKTPQLYHAFNVLTHVTHVPQTQLPAYLANQLIYYCHQRAHATARWENSKTQLIANLAFQVATPVPIILNVLHVGQVTIGI